MAPELKISKKHHKHLNNPLPPPPNSLPFIHGTLSNSLPNHQTFPIGDDFHLIWSPENGGHLSISHQSNPNKLIWFTTPGHAFLSAGVVQTEIEESRGSFAVNDGEVSLICHHQSIDEIRVFHQSDIVTSGQNLDFLSGFLESEKTKETHFPILLITGWVFSKNKKRRIKFRSLDRKKFVVEHSLAARYWVFLDQKNSHQIGFNVRFGEFNQKWSKGAPSRFSNWKLVRVRRRPWNTTCCMSPRRFFAGFFDGERKEEEEEEEKVGLVFTEFNRVFITYSSEKDERFYGFGEQFSHMEFKGKKVPILVQEQGIGRGDQPITCAANLVSYRYKSIPISNDFVI